MIFTQEKRISDKIESIFSIQIAQKMKKRGRNCVKLHPLGKVVYFTDFVRGSFAGVPALRGNFGGVGRIF